MILLKTTGLFIIASVLFFVIPAQGQTFDSIYTLPKGTKIRVRMDNEINSKVSSVNDTFTAAVSSPVIIRGVEVLPIRTVIEGRITGVKSASPGKKNGKLDVLFETLFLPDGGKRRIEAVLVEIEKPESPHQKNILTIAGATGVGGLLGSFIQKSRGALIGAGIGLGIGTSIALLQKGKEARIKAEEEFTILLKNDVALPPQDY